MKQLLATVLILMLLFVEFGATVVLVDFQLDRERIIRELCVQRDLLPEMQSCKGNCVLSKKLKAAEQGADHPMDLTLFEYSATTGLASPIETDLPIMRSFGIACFEELTGYPSAEDVVPWLG